MLEAIGFVQHETLPGYLRPPYRFRNLPRGTEDFCYNPVRTMSYWAKDYADLALIGQPRSRPQHAVPDATSVRIFFRSIRPLANDSQDEDAS